VFGVLISCHHTSIYRHQQVHPLSGRVPNHDLTLHGMSLSNELAPVLVAIVLASVVLLLLGHTFSNKGVSYTCYIHQDFPWIFNLQQFSWPLS
jgi:cytosine/uracil/thiamine/allantoin permease